MGRHFIWLLTLMGVLATAPVFALVERRVERRFETAARPELIVDTFSGAVHVTEIADANAIEVVVLQSADVQSEAEMDERLASIALEIRQQRNGAVEVSARSRKPVTVSWDSKPAVTLVYEIRVPSRCDVQVATREGRVVIGSMEGRVSVRNESGSIFLGEIDGPVNVRSDTGHVGITAATGTITASTVTGNITVGRTRTKTRLSSKGGYMEIQRARGEVVVRGSGSDAQVGFTTPVTHPADISLSGGGLTLVVETASECVLDMHASVFGKVALRGELPLKVIAGAAGQSRLKVSVNGGGPRIVARAKGGSILVRAVEPLPVMLAEGATAVK